MTDRKVYGVTQHVDAITADKNKDLIDYVMKDMTRKLVDVAAEQASDGEKIISIKDDPVEMLKYPNQLIYKKRMYIEDLIRCRNCEYFYKGFNISICTRPFHAFSVGPNGYCAWAVRKEEE